jgi:Tfp pilus assembly protein PilV
MRKEAGSQKPEATRGIARGFSLLEVMLLVIVLGIVGGAAGRALQSMAKVPGQTDQNFQIETRLISKMEEIRALTFDAITAGIPNQTLSDTVVISGVSYNRTVNVTAMANPDGSGNSGTFKEVTITCGGQSVSSRISK